MAWLLQIKDGGGGGVRGMERGSGSGPQELQEYHYLPFLFVHVPVLPGFAVTVDLVVVVAVTATCALPAPYAVSTLFAVSAPLAVTLNQCCGAWIRVRWAGGEVWAGLSPTTNLG